LKRIFLYPNLKHKPMRALLFILAITLMSCSKDDDKQIQSLNISGTWELSNGTFNGNGTAGVTDPFFNGTTFETEDFDGSIRLMFLFPNGAGGNAWLINESGVYKSRPINDTGIKTSNHITTNYSGQEMLLSSDDVEIVIDISNDEIFDITIDNNTMSWTRQSEGYEITYNFIR
jgi:hypothetical protein